ncbi:hypothetical protein Scep_026512 [Stephania cephalantha]|uniref:Uncharacterized protein n=1 Tax=Stephania cephalantha TaxID=152367 RepID=A0AAP0EQW9_9MAGN
MREMLKAWTFFIKVPYDLSYSNMTLFKTTAQLALMGISYYFMDLFKITPSTCLEACGVLRIKVLKKSKITILWTFSKSHHTFALKLGLILFKFAYGLSYSNMTLFKTTAQLALMGLSYSNMTLFKTTPQLALMMPTYPLEVLEESKHTALVFFGTFPNHSTPFLKAWTFFIKAAYHFMDLFKITPQPALKLLAFYGPFQNHSSTYLEALFFGTFQITPHHALKLAWTYFLYAAYMEPKSSIMSECRLNDSSMTNVMRQFKKARAA